MSFRLQAVNKMNNINSFNHQLIKDLVMYILTHDSKYDNVDYDNIDLDSIVSNYSHIHNDFTDSSTRIEMLEQEIRNELLSSKYKFEDTENQYYKFN